MNFTALLKFYNRTPNLPYERLNMYEIWNVFKVYTPQKYVKGSLFANQLW